MSKYDELYEKVYLEMEEIKKRGPNPDNFNPHIIRTRSQDYNVRYQELSDEFKENPENSWLKRSIELLNNFPSPSKANENDMCRIFHGICMGLILEEFFGCYMQKEIRAAFRELNEKLKIY